MAYRKMDGVSVLLCVVFTFCMTPVITVVNLFVSLFATSGNESVNSVVSGIPLLAGLLFVGVLPAFSEEFIFRGTVYGGLRKNGMVPAALVSGLIFGAMHMNLNQFAYAFVLGAVFAFLIEATGSIFAPMIVHFVFNSTSVVLSSVLVYLNDYLEKSGVYDDSMTAAAVTDSTAYMAAFIIYVPLAIGGAILCWLIFKYLAKRAGRTEHIKQMWKYRTGQSCFSIPLVIGLVLSVTYMILSEIVS